ncbi:hypothetical protein RFI_06593 [Reticulomyxa filosa]|uniref:Uncharacterized protein n=1 Tax=Reticulomyxa filosa TaxID=46433 RepID=X6NXI1_RETFI|nr:hypothetical protein RFI_06593 [Reticulomyxa filosa]|eukprot:ETO30529.1 hypothetical protein RFI_06593 [Reticulomyxa filosa]
MVVSAWAVAFVYILPYFVTILFIYYKSRTSKVSPNVLTGGIGGIDENKEDGMVVVGHRKQSSGKVRRSHVQGGLERVHDTEEELEEEENDAQLHRRQSSGTVDLTKLHDITHTSTWQGAPSSKWESCIAFVHSCDTGLHLGLLTNLIENSNRGNEWDLTQQYLIVGILILVFYRVSSFLVLWFYFPRYSYTKTASGNRALLSAAIAQGGPSIHLNRLGAANTLLYKSEPSCVSCINYCWLQLIFDAGYLLELAPWLFNWDYTRILVPEFAWFCKVRSLTESFPFCLFAVTFLMYGENSSFDNDVQHFALLSLFVSVLSILLSLSLYDTTCLALDSFHSHVFVRFANHCYRLFQVVSRVLVLAFFIALFPWWVLFLVILIPLVANSGPFKLGRTDNEPYNFIYQSLLAFPDYSSPFGRIASRDNFLNRLNRLHYFVLVILGSPLIFVRMFVEFFAGKFLHMNKSFFSTNKQTNKQTNNNNTIQYNTILQTLNHANIFGQSGGVRVIFLELIFIGIELYGTGKLHKASVNVQSSFTIASYWIAVMSTWMFLIAFYPIRHEFVKDSLADETKALAASKAGKAVFVQVNRY